MYECLFFFFILKISSSALNPVKSASLSNWQDNKTNNRRTTYLSTRGREPNEGKYFCTSKRVRNGADVVAVVVHWRVVVVENDAVAASAVTRDCCRRGTMHAYSIIVRTSSGVRALVFVLTCACVSETDSYICMYIYIYPVRSYLCERERERERLKKKRKSEWAIEKKIESDREEHGVRRCVKYKIETNRKGWRNTLASWRLGSFVRRVVATGSAHRCHRHRRSLL